MATAGKQIKVDMEMNGEKRRGDVRPRARVGGPRAEL